MSRFRAWDDYLYPGTEVLRNRQDIRDSERLREFEEDSAFLRMSEILVKNPIPGDLDRAHMCAIHRHIFGDVYEWAGAERMGPVFPGVMTKGEPSPQSIEAGRYASPDEYPYSYFPAGDEMVRHFDRWMGHLNRPDEYGHMSPAEFAEAIAEPWGEINVAHLFREGNTRTQVAFFTYFSWRHGHSLDYTRFSTDVQFRLKFNAGRFLIQAGKPPHLLIDVLTEVMDRPSVGTKRAIDGSVPSMPSSPRDAGGQTDDYRPHYVSRSASRRSGSSSGGAPTTKGAPCQRRGRCPYHG